MSGESFCGFCVGWEGGLWLVIAWCRKWETTKSCVSRHNRNSLLEERFGNVCAVGQIPYTFKELEGWDGKWFLFPPSEWCLHGVLQIDLNLLGQADELRAALGCCWNLGCWACVTIRCSRSPGCQLGYMSSCLPEEDCVDTSKLRRHRVFLSS